MTQVAWRIAKARHAGSIDEMFSGVGAAINGGRWNSRGVHMVYASESLALATLELAVHLNNAGTLAAYSACRVEVPDALCEEVGASDLPDGWDELVINPLEAQSWGDLWIARGATPAVKVPSVLIPSEWNFLLNPEHADFKRITFGKINPFPIDRRIKDDGRSRPRLGAGPS